RTARCTRAAHHAGAADQSDDGRAVGPARWRRTAAALTHHAGGHTMDVAASGGAATGAPASAVEGAASVPTPEAHRAPKGPDGRFRQVQDVADAQTSQARPEASQGGGETPAEAAARRKLELKINGEVRTGEFDDASLKSLADLYGVSQEELTATMQKSLAGHRAMSEAAKERRALAKEREEMQRRIERLKQSPDDVLAELGVDPDELALRRLQAAAQREAMTPEQLALAEREQAISQREAKLQ